MEALEVYSFCINDIGPGNGAMTTDFLFGAVSDSNNTVMPCELDYHRLSSLPNNS